MRKLITAILLALSLMATATVVQAATPAETVKKPSGVTVIGGSVLAPPGSSGDTIAYVADQLGS